jgi:hypothetical protein
MMSRKTRILPVVVLPAIPLVPLLFLSSGCNFTTTVQAFDSSHDYRKLIQDRGDGGLFATGKRDRDGVEQILGKPAICLALESPEHVCAHYYFDDTSRSDLIIFLGLIGWSGSWEGQQAHQLQIYYHDQKVVEVVMDQKRVQTQ